MKYNKIFILFTVCIYFYQNGPRGFCLPKEMWPPELFKDWAFQKNTGELVYDDKHRRVT